MNALALAGFAADFTACSANPEIDGFVGTRGEWPYHVHPTETPAEWEILQVAIASGEAAITHYTGPTLEDARLAKVAELQAIYAQAVSHPVISFTTQAGTTANFSCKTEDASNIAQCVAAGAKAWMAGIWLDAGGVIVAPFSFSDLEALSAAIGAHTPPTCPNLMALISQVHNASTVTEVQSVNWPTNKASG